ncbi:hypothetical protein JCM21900_005968 [Sporobolomyces salmonicolor]
MTTTLLDLDGDGYADAAGYDLPYGYGGGIGAYGEGGGYAEVYEGGYEGEYGRGYGGDYLGGYGGEYGGASGEDYGGGYLDSGYDDPYLSWDDGGVDLYDATSYIEHEVPIYDAWQAERWDEPQYAFADLLSYQRHLELDRELDEDERLKRWEERLRWEELDEEERAVRYRELDPYRRSVLGLSDGFWGRRFGGRTDLDLSYLRQVPLQRGLFAPQYRSSFVRHPNLGRRYQPYFSRARLRAFARPPPMINPRPSAAYTSRPLSMSGGPLSLREQELRSRLRMAEVRASLTGLSPQQRARALDDARLIRQELNAEHRLTRELDRAERRTDALHAAREMQAERNELREEMREMQGVQRLNVAAEELMTRPIPGGYAAGGAGYRGGYEGGYGRPYY